MIETYKSGSTYGRYNDTKHNLKGIRKSIMLCSMDHLCKIGLWVYSGEKIIYYL